MQPRGAVRPGGRVGLGGPVRPGGMGLGGLGQQRPSGQVLPVTQGGPPASYVPPGGQPSPGPAATPPPAHAQFTPDAQYLAEQAQHAFERQQQYNQLDSAQRTDDSDTAEAIRRLLSGVPEQRRQITAGANKAGLLYSGQLAKGLGDYESGIAQQQGDAQLDKQRRTDERNAVRAALASGATLEEAAARAEAIGRQIERDAGAASMNSLAPPPTDPVSVIAQARAQSLKPGGAAHQKAQPKPKPVAARGTTRKRRQGKAGKSRAGFGGGMKRGGARRQTRGGIK